MHRPIKQLVISLTGQCNFACSYCYASEQDKNKLSPAQAIAAVDLVVKHNRNIKQNEDISFILQLSGGEPLLNWEAIEAVVDYVRVQRIPARLQVQTNGALLDDYKAKYLFENKVGIGVSLDGRPKINDAQRFTKDGTSAALATLKGIEVLKRNNIACGLTCVVTEQNVAELERLVEFAYYLGNIRVMGFDLLRPQGRGHFLKPAKPEQLAQALVKVYRKSEMLHKLLGYGISFSEIKKCSAGLTSAGRLCHCNAMLGEALFVDAKGDLYGCASYIGKEEFYLGDLGTGISKARAEKLNLLFKEAMSTCLGCKDFQNCGGGCLARWYNNSKLHEYKSECVLKQLAKK